MMRSMNDALIDIDTQNRPYDMFIYNKRHLQHIHDIQNFCAIYMHIYKSIWYLTSPVILSWQPKLRPVSVLPSSKCNLANADGGLVSSPDWVAINRVEAESLVRLILPLVEMRFRNAVLRAAFSMDDMMTWYMYCIVVLLGLEYFVLWKRLLSWYLLMLFIGWIWMIQIYDWLIATRDWF